VSTTNTNAEADDLVAKDAKYVMRPWSHPKGEPVIIARGSGCVVTDVHGKDYLDFTAGYFVNNAGHCHPRIIEAATGQLHQILQVSGKHGTPALVNLAERFVKLAPKTIEKAFFCTGGSEANEFGLKLARQYTKKTDIAYVENGYHGLTLGSLEVTYSKPYRESAGVPLSDHTYTIPVPYCYRCDHNKDCATQCLDGVEAKFASRPNTAALIAEPVQAAGGIIPPPAWWSRLDAMRKKAGILLFLDEVQTGLGRTGKMFAAEHYGLEPDIMTGGKGLSGGVGSLAVAASSDTISAKFFGGTTPTSGGNAVSAAAGLAMIDVLIDEKLLENAAKMGEYFTRALWDLKDPWIGDVRFLGLLGGAELVSDRDSREVLPKAKVSAIKDGLHDAGVLITVSGPHGNVLRLQPPLSITTAQLDQMVGALQKVLQAVRKAA
jgi:4-aminobutyrate aminotransferase / (S)-3-amino-2-methylpropionate transaminase / 5-aminovalerate transaminase